MRCVHCILRVNYWSCSVSIPGWVHFVFSFPNTFFWGGLHILEQSSLPNSHDWISAIFGLNILRRFIILLNLYSSVVITVGTLICVTQKIIICVM